MAMIADVYGATEPATAAGLGHHPRLPVGDPTGQAAALERPEHWRDRVEGLTRAPAMSFRLGATRQSEKHLLDVVDRPKLLSAAINHYFAAQTINQYPFPEDCGEKAGST